MLDGRRSRACFSVYTDAPARARCRVLAEGASASLEGTSLPTSDSREDRSVVDIFVIRHAIAALRSETVPDAERALTPEGHAKLGKVVAGLARLDVELDQVLHSPWRRAVETAAGLGPLLRRGAVVRATPELARSPREALLAELDGGRAALVGHEPWMGELVAWLVLGDRAQGAHFALKKAGVAWLRGDPRPGGCALHALLPPRYLRRLAS